MRIINLNPHTVMLQNHVYNLIEQMAHVSKSLWRIKNDYGKDSGDCASCKAFWEKLTEEKDGHVKELMRLIEDHLG